MQAGGRDEWRQYWTLPMAAALGNSASVLHVYSLGAFMEPLQLDFGWTRTEISVGITVTAILAAILIPGVGFIVDRWGPRRVGLLGVTIMCGAIALLGTATGSIANWLMLWCLVAIGSAWVQPTIWTSAVASRFDASRGLAIAVTISGSGVAATVIPALATWTIIQFGWRAGFAVLGLAWVVVLLPFLFLFFRGAQDQRVKLSSPSMGPAGDALEGLTVGEGLRSVSFYKLAIAGMLFSFVVVGLIVHFVPIMHDGGLDLMAAASIAGLVGIASIAGRLGTGFLLDRFRADRVAMIAFLLPTAAAVLLLNSGGPVAMAGAALIIGLSLGSELDVVLYLATRHFGLKRFGMLFGLMLIGLGIGTALGPVVAGAVFDHFGTYSNFILLIFPLMILGSVLVGTLGLHPDHGHIPQGPEA